MKVLKWRPEEESGFVVARPDDKSELLGLVESMLDGEPGDRYLIEIGEMTEAELRALPEHQGW